MRTDLGQWLYQSSFCLWARRGAAGAAFGRVWDPPLQKTKPFRVCRRGRTLAGPPGNGRRLGRAAQCAAPTKKRERSEISVGAGPRPARGRPHGAAPTGSPSPKGRLSGDRKGRPYVFPKTAGGSGTRPYKRQNTKPFRVCRRGRILAGPSGNGRRLGRAARCAAPTAIQHRCRWFGKPRRRHGTAPAEIFANSGPVARREFRVSLRFCAPEIHCQAKGMTPVNGGPRGAANMDTKCPS